MMMDSSGQDKSADQSDGDEQTNPEYEALRDAFVAGFITGRTGSYYRDIRGISRRAAVTEFQNYYQHQQQSHQDAD